MAGNRDDAGADGADDERRVDAHDAADDGRQGDDGDRDVGADLGRPVEGLAGSVDRLRAGVRRGYDAVRRAVESRGPPPLLGVPTTVTDGAGRAVTCRPYRDADREALVAMYDGWDPADRAQGTPPLGTDAVRDWLDDVMDGPNVVAVHEDAAPRVADGGSDGRVVGHAMFVPDGTGRHEFAIFVDADYRGAGVGTTLALAGMAHAAAGGVDYVWLSVEAGERGLQRWYSGLGFSTVNPMGYAHRMSRRLPAPGEDGGGAGGSTGDDGAGGDPDEATGTDGTDG